LITHLLRNEQKVGLTAQSHKVIHNLLEEVERAAKEEGLDFRGVKYGDHFESEHVKPGRLVDVPSGSQRKKRLLRAPGERTRTGPRQRGGMRPFPSGTSD
jgi:hypothetical protein